MGLGRRVCGGGWQGGPGCPRVSRRWSGSYAGAGYPKTLFRRASAVYKRARPPGRLLIAQNAELVVRKCRESRTALPAATGVRLCGSVQSMPDLAVIEALTRANLPTWAGSG